MRKQEKEVVSQLQISIENLYAKVREIYRAKAYNRKNITKARAIKTEAEGYMQHCLECIDKLMGKGEK